MPGGMQVIPIYKRQAHTQFVAWYLEEFANKRMAYVHWSAGSFTQTFPAYHKTVVFRKGKAYVHHEHDLDTDSDGHTYHRNTGSFAVSVACMAGGSTQDLGPCQPRVEQLQELVRFLAEACISKRIPVGNIMTHAEAADNRDYRSPVSPDAPHEPYGPTFGCERWDFWVWIDPDTLNLLPCTAQCPRGWLYFPDWLRGEVLLRIQRLTEGKWKGQIKP